MQSIASAGFTRQAVRERPVADGCEFLPPAYNVSIGDEPGRVPTYGPAPAGGKGPDGVYLPPPPLPLTPTQQAQQEAKTVELQKWLAKADYTVRQDPKTQSVILMVESSEPTTATRNRYAFVYGDDQVQQSQWYHDHPAAGVLVAAQVSILTGRPNLTAWAQAARNIVSNRAYLSGPSQPVIRNMPIDSEEYKAIDRRAVAVTPQKEQEILASLKGKPLLTWDVGTPIVFNTKNFEQYIEDNHYF